MTTTPAFPVRLFEGNWKLPELLQTWLDNKTLLALQMPCDMGWDGPCIHAPYTPTLVFADGISVSTPEEIATRFANDPQTALIVKGALFDLMNSPDWRMNPAAECWHKHTENLIKDNQRPYDLLVTLFADGAAWVWSVEPQSTLPDNDRSAMLVDDQHNVRDILDEEDVVFDALGVLTFPDAGLEASAHSVATILQRIPKALDDLNRFLACQNWHQGPQRLLQLLEDKLIRTPGAGDLKKDGLFDV